jgi:heme-degrading monooxygenase HmoA
MTDSQPNSGTHQEAFVVSSEVTISPQNGGQLEQAFRDRLHLVESAPGFQRLEVWQDIALPGVFVMVSWWDDDERFREYMKSDAHRRSHARIPSVPERPRGTRLRRYRRVNDAGASDRD